MRILCLVIVGAVLSSTLAGCGSSEEAVSATPTETQAANAAKANEVMKEQMLKVINKGKGGSRASKK